MSKMKLQEGQSTNLEERVRMIVESCHGLTIETARGSRPDRCNVKNEVAGRSLNSPGREGKHDFPAVLVCTTMTGYTDPISGRGSSGR
jgi:hypothetical protein